MFDIRGKSDKALIGMGCCARGITFNVAKFMKYDVGYCREKLGCFIILLYRWIGMREMLFMGGITFIYVHNFIG